MLSPRFKSLEALIQESVSRLKKLADENRRLRLEADHLMEENGRLEGELKRFKTLGTRHERLKTKVERLAHKLDKVLP